MLSPLGKALRQYRLDTNLLLKDMSRKLGVSASFLSALEHGKRKIPANFTDRLEAAFLLNEKQKEKIEEAARQTRLQEQETVTISMHGLRNDQRELARVFVERFETLNESQIRKIISLLLKDEG